MTSLGLAGEAGIFASRPFYPVFSGVPNGPLRLSPPQVHAAVHNSGDTDPGFTQIRHLTTPAFLEEARKHTAFFSFGENIGKPICQLPDDGLPWQATRQPVTLDDWPVTPPPPDGRVTTVLSWNSFGAMEYGGRRYGMKDDSLRALGDLPRKTHSAMELEVCMIPEESVPGWPNRARMFAAVMISCLHRDATRISSAVRARKSGSRNTVM